MADNKNPSQNPNSGIEHETNFYINASNVDQAVPDTLGDHTIVPSGSLIHKDRIQAAIAKKAPWFVQYKGELKGKHIVGAPDDLDVNQINTQRSDALNKKLYSYGSEL